MLRVFISMPTQKSHNRYSTDSPFRQHQRLSTICSMNNNRPPTTTQSCEQDYAIQQKKPGPNGHSNCVELNRVTDVPPLTRVQRDTTNSESQSHSKHNYRAALAIAALLSIVNTDFSLRAVCPRSYSSCFHKLQCQFNSHCYALFSHHFSSNS